jgi:sec-independent protein translocase protein TatB
MFDFSWSELLLIGIVALIFIGPKELPGVLRTLGQWMTKIRRMAGDFQNQFHDAMREAELADLKKEVDEMAAQAANYSNFDPLADVRKDLENTQREVESAVAGTPAGQRAAAGEPAGAAPPAGEPVPAVPHADGPVVEPVGPSPATPPVAAAGEPAQDLPKDPVHEPNKHSAVRSEPE